MTFIKKISRTILLAILLLTFAELAVSLTGEFSGNIGTMQAISKNPAGVGNISTKAPDLERAVSDVVNFDPALWQSFLQSLPLKLYTFTFNDFLNDLFGFSDSPLSWIIIGLVSWQVIWKQSGHNEVKN